VSLSRACFLHLCPCTNISIVGFYAGLNLIAWGMIFCFVRETKQLTLEEIDRKCQLLCSTQPHQKRVLTLHHRGLPSPHQEVHWPRAHSLASLVHPIQDPSPEDPEAACHHRHRGQCYRRSQELSATRLRIRLVQVYIASAIYINRNSNDFPHRRCAPSMFLLIMYSSRKV
jgi:hypothetical protein